MNLEFIVEDKGTTAREIEAKIEREATKTKEQKLEDFKKTKKTLPMAGGGQNDFL